ncbi:hypothetical protein MMC13_004211 [Lambiella insularis]|nr:hypothetical protein [Lambiella insularis]
MGSLDNPSPLPNAQSPDLRLSHPTPNECQIIWRLTSLAWRDALTLPQYLEESAYLTTVPLAKDGVMTLWILVDGNLPPDQRPILCSCETFRKCSLISDSEGDVTETIIHGVASVFCDPEYRRRGYASRMMRELAQALRSWQVESKKCVGSVLYSDIGKHYYSNLGWLPVPNNGHIELQPSIALIPSKARQILSEDLEQLCKEDEAMIRDAMSRTSDEKRRMVLVPDLDHMGWHHKKEEWVCDKLFGKVPQIKGAIAGQPGNRIWAIWTHRFYGDPKSVTSDNTLYILRLVVEKNQVAESTLSSEGRDLPYDSTQLKLQAQQLKAVLQAAQAEAAEWKLSHVNLWDPTPLAQKLIEQCGIDHIKVERDYEGIASLLWYGDGSDNGNVPQWIGNEKYAWC